jgi:hypothetical protein
MINVRQEARKNAQFIEAECLGGASACGTISCVILTEKGDNFRECVAAAVRQVRCGLMLLIASLEPMAPMLDRPSDDEVSRQILGVFMRHRIPASGILQRNDFFDVRDGDFQRGLNKAVAKDHNRSTQSLPLPTHCKGLCRGADDRPGTWPTDKCRKTIEVDLETCDATAAW